MPSEHQINAVVKARSAGCPNELCARAAGVARSTLWRWLKASEEEPDKYHHLHKKWHAAEVERVELLLSLVLTAAKTGTWQAAAWILERTRPKDFCTPQVRLGLEEEQAEETNPLEGWEGMDAEERREAIRKLHGWG